MASAQDILDAINTSIARLDQLHNDVLAGTNSTDAVRNAVTDMAQHLDAGFTVLAQGDQVIAALHAQTNAILMHLAAQADTQICLLDTIARNTCALLNESVRQTAAQDGMRTDLDGLAFMYATVNPGSAVELDRSRQAAARMDECCPPPAGEPPCTFDGCAAPDRLKEHRVDPKIPAYPYAKQGAQVTVKG
jgi:hypothetical protein